jgi:hypothetical protein
VKSAEVLSLAIQSCHSSFREKFILTMKGIDKLVVIIFKSAVATDDKEENQEKVEHLFDTISCLLVDGGEASCEVFKN